MPSMAAKSTAPVPRTLLYCWVSNGLSVLVPKRRGTGYLKVPYGHHHNDALTSIANEVGCDMIGLDGELAFDGIEVQRLYVVRDARAAFTAKVMPLLEKHYQMDSREIDADLFWELHPLK